MPKNQSRLRIKINFIGKISHDVFREKIIKHTGDHSSYGYSKKPKFNTPIHILFTRSHFQKSSLQLGKKQKFYCKFYVLGKINQWIRRYVDYKLTCFDGPQHVFWTQLSLSVVFGQSRTQSSVWSLSVTSGNALKSINSGWIVVECIPSLWKNSFTFSAIFIYSDRFRHL